MNVRCDLHIHSCASPCGSLEMSPKRIAAEARRAGVDILALTDHNTARNTPAFEKTCRSEGIVALYGMEVTSREEAHILSIFPDVETAMEMGELIEDNLPRLSQSPSPFGDQIYVDEEEYILGEIHAALFSATEFSTEEIVDMTHKRGGLVIPSHIDRPSFSIVMQLGFLPRLAFDAVECSSPPCTTDTYGIPIVTNSDAHYPEDIGTRTSIFDMETPSFDGLKEALKRRSATRRAHS